jgi:hypothetical protein
MLDKLKTFVYNLIIPQKPKKECKMPCNSKMGYGSSKKPKKQMPTPKAKKKK